MQEAWWRVTSKYFLHGILFSILFVVLGVLWIAVLMVPILVGLFIGLIIGLVILLFIVGGLNSLLTNIIWPISVKTDWRTILGHGFTLSLLSILVNLLSIFINASLPSLPTTAALFIFYAFPDGFFGKNVAARWSMEEAEEYVSRETPKSFLKRCTNCGQEIPIACEHAQFVVQNNDDVRSQF